MAPPSSPSRAPRPLDEERLRELGLSYVGRFATTRAKLVSYLGRKLRERGWSGAKDPALAELAERLARLGYIDDAAYALAKARSLGQRGYGARRVDIALRQAGVGEDDGQAARAASANAAVSSAVRFAQRKRIGPFGIAEHDLKQRQRDLSAMIRAGHDFDLAKRIIGMAPEGGLDVNQIINSLLN